jgi:hypothetical protein
MFNDYPGLKSSLTNFLSTKTASIEIEINKIVNSPVPIWVVSRSKLLTGNKIY